MNMPGKIEFSSITMIINFLILITLCCSCTPPAYHGDAGPLSNEVFSPSTENKPIIDGFLGHNEWSDARAYEVELEWFDFMNNPTGEKTTVLLLAKNDGDNIYLGLRYNDESWDADFQDGEIKSMDICSLIFDKNDSGIPDSGDDRKGLVPIWYGAFFDYHGTEESELDSRFDGNGKIKYREKEGLFHAEFEIPFNSGDADDILINPGDEIGFSVDFIDQVNLDLGSVRGLTQLFRNFPNEKGHFLGTLITSAAVSTSPPVLPAFTGKMVIRDCRDFAKGDFFIYNFNSGVLTRITDGNTNPVHNFYKDNPSLSSDGEWVVFHGSTSQHDYVNYKLYKIRTDGTGLTELINSNGEVRGHPAWSPNGMEIAYVSLRESGGDIHVCDNDGNLLRILTSSIDDNNDPDWSPDGTRIIFKSSYWTDKEQLCVMDSVNDDLVSNPRGKNLVRFTGNGCSDHDGVYSVDGQWIFYERYVGPGLWFESFHPDTMWGPKDKRFNRDLFVVRKIRSDGSDDQKIEDNPEGLIVQWLPVGGRTETGASGIAWIRDMGIDYNVIMWQSDEGGEPVRIVPELTYVMYIDWK